MPDDGVIGKLPRSRPGTRSPKRAARATGSGSRAAASRPRDRPPARPETPAEPILPLRAARLAGQAAESGQRAASRAAGGVLGRLPRP